MPGTYEHDLIWDKKDFANVLKELEMERLSQTIQVGPKCHRMSVIKGRQREI